ncbi:kinase-like protein [Athelia psychrophila]|uniref:Kinase-like protein n=2 Tax=Athelia psychrophila TaxID=1759441 RepID=A0A166Q5V0_9AGAM|nr:kinase-like protein [Fibularhizoctonia sp. CBS 109695]
MPCLGVTLDYGLVASLVMPMCPDGSINEYVKEHPNANKLALLSQVAGGVAYLHSRGVVHGKICGRNIVIAPNGRPLITDTGLTQVIQAQEGIFPWRLPSESVRWMAPELFASELDDAYTTSSDVWALAMTILEVMSGEMPYHPRRQVHATALAIMDGVLPQRPDNGIISDDLWDALNMMWTRNPDIRPHAPFVQWQLDVLRHAVEHPLYKL